MMPAQRLSRISLTCCTLVVALAVLGAQLGALHWAGDILALVVDTSLWGALLLLLVCAFARAWRLTALAGAALLLSGYQLAVYPAAEPALAPPAAQTRDLRLLVYNIYHLNSDLDAIVDEVRRHDPDMIFLMEYSHDVQQQIEPAFADYPYRLIQPSRFTMGLALFSRIPFDSAEARRAEETRIPVYQVQLRVDGRPFTLVGGHPWPPRPQWGQLHRDQMLAITQVAEASSGPLIVAGDFNAAPWSYTMRQLAERAGVRQVRRPLDMTKTWHLLPLVGLPIDHVLVSDEWQVLAYQYGAPGGSDHIPLIVDLRLP
jgi:endonuclease/exonuclease/phosphatase (EEP) superfamily protein YafD